VWNVIQWLILQCAVLMARNIVYSIMTINLFCVLMQYNNVSMCLLLLYYDIMTILILLYIWYNIMIYYYYYIIITICNTILLILLIQCNIIIIIIIINTIIIMTDYYTMATAYNTTAIINAMIPILCNIHQYLPVLSSISGRNTMACVAV